MVMGLWPFLLSVNGLYPTNRARTINRALVIIVKSSFQGLVIILAILFMFKSKASRLLVFGVSVSATGFLILKEFLVIWYLRFLRTAGRNVRNVLIIGEVEKAKEINDIIVKNKFLGLDVVGFLVPRAEVSEERISDNKILGNLEDIEKALHEHPIDNVIIALSRRDYGEVENIIYHCEEEGVELWLTAGLFNIKIARFDTDELFGLPIIVFRTGPSFSWQLFAKNVFDKVIAVVLSILSIPVIGMAAVAIRLESEGPAIFLQKRLGLHGRVFVLYKLRTMYMEAEKTKKELEADNIMKGPVFKMDKDPRVTKMGRFLRKFSIDEFPQFWNVIKGDMSLIGPRPPLFEEVVRYEGWQRRRLSMKPGITGLWQVKGRNRITDFAEWARLDLKYIDEWSLWLDIKIFFTTIWVVLTGIGAK